MAGKKKERIPLTHERVRELFDYNPETGIVTRRIDIRGGNQYTCHKRGSIVGGINKGSGYLTVKVDGRSYQLHRIIWLWLYGYFPEHSIDHISRNKLDNTQKNLREVTHQCNTRNTKIRSDNTSGMKGVSWFKGSGKWGAYICVGGREVYLGVYACYIEAVAHRLAAEQFLGWSGCDSTSPAFMYMQAHLKDRGIIK